MNNQSNQNEFLIFNNIDHIGPEDSDYFADMKAPFDYAGGESKFQTGTPISKSEKMPVDERFNREYDLPQQITGAPCSEPKNVRYFISPEKEHTNTIPYVQRIEIAKSICGMCVFKEQCMTVAIKEISILGANYLHFIKNNVYAGATIGEIASIIDQS